MSRFVLAGMASAMVGLVMGALFLAIMKPVAAGAPSYRVTPVGGMEYETMNVHPIDLHNAAERRLVAGLPASERPGKGDLLFGAFVSVTNASHRPLRSSDRIELRDEAGHLYAPIALPKRDPYAYSPRTIRPGTRIPAQGSPADSDLAATGDLLLFRIPARTYDDGGVLELVIHQSGATKSLIV